LEYEKAVGLCPQFADLRVRLGTLLREMNDLPRAREQYEAAVAARPAYIPARMQLGVTLLSLGDSDGAADQWNKVLEIEPDNARAKMYLRMVAAARASGSLPAAPPASPGPQGSAGG